MMVMSEGTYFWCICLSTMQIKYNMTFKQLKFNILEYYIAIFFGYVNFHTHNIYMWRKKKLKKP
jgi:hypothetical protein